MTVEEKVEQRREFTVMRSQWLWEDRHLIESCPASIPWEIVSAHERQVQRNHYQTSHRLNERGGLSPQELYYVLRDEPWPHDGCVSMAEAIAFLRQHLLAPADGGGRRVEEGKG